MKKTVLFALLSFLCVFANAADIKIIFGSVSVLKEKAKAVVEYDYSSTRWEDDEDFKTWCGEDYQKRKDAISNAFMSSFNENSKGIVLSTNPNESKYKFVLNIKNLERHQSFTGMWGQGKISVTGTLNIIDISNNNSVCTIEIDGYGDGKDFDITDGMAKCFKGLAKAILKIKK